VRTASSAFFRSSSVARRCLSEGREEKNNPLVNIFLAGMNELRVSVEAGSAPSAHMRDTCRRAFDNLDGNGRGPRERTFGLRHGRLATVGPPHRSSASSHGVRHHGQLPRIANSGTTNLAVVAPGIAEALLTTAIGLAAAIPAVIMYNLLRPQGRRL